MMWKVYSALTKAVVVIQLMFLVVYLVYRAPRHLSVPLLTLFAMVPTAYLLVVIHDRMTNAAIRRVIEGIVDVLLSVLTIFVYLLAIVLIVPAVFVLVGFELFCDELGKKESKWLLFADAVRELWEVMR